jgi:hypothetical protein
LFVLLTILFTFFVFWVEFQRYYSGCVGGCGGGGGGGCCWVVVVVVVSVVVVLVVVEKGGRGLFRCNYD